jgi:hypothetical protein
LQDPPKFTQIGIFGLKTNRFSGFFSKWFENKPPGNPVLWAGAWMTNQING